MDASDEPIDERYRAMMNALADTLQEFLQPNGFVLLMFDGSSPPRVNYISNCNRDDVLQAMQSFMDRARPRHGQD